MTAVFPVSAKPTAAPGCGQCNPHCPQGIDIPAKLQEIDRFVEALKQETL